VTDAGYALESVRARLDGYEAMTIPADETVFKTGGFPDD